MVRDQAVSASNPLHAFVPPEVCDSHAHLLRRSDANATIRGWLADGEGDFGIASYRTNIERDLGISPRAGLFFALPVSGIDFDAANEFVFKELRKSPGSRGLLLIDPEDDPAAVEAEVVAHRWAGFKPYHLFARCENTYEAELTEYLPEWCWQLAHELELALMIHLVRSRALADEANQSALLRLCVQYPGATVILAHAGRGFCARHTIEGVERLSCLGNLYFDTSAICEAPALQAVLRVFGPQRLLFGTDFPVSQMTGRCVSVGDGFAWLDQAAVEPSRSPFARPERIGVESLIALQQACWLERITDEGVEQIFSGNAKRLLGIEAGGGIVETIPGSSSARSEI
ncbi:MAG TPA: amidohydrolase family protein [Caulifigura sp.]|nr:amidohydrolase family protein [Caulifigura sp.]